MDAIVFGARGFLGTHIMDALCEAGQCGVMAPRRAVLDLGAGDPSQVVAAIERTGATVLVNAAGLTHGSPFELARANVFVVRTLLEACRRVDRRMRLVHLGSAAEYGPGEPGTTVREDAPARPRTAYAHTKAEATDLVLNATRDGVVDGVVLRVFNPLGAHQPPWTAPGQVADRLSRLAPMAGLLVGPVDTSRDYVDARDVGAAVVAAATTPVTRGEVINLGRGRAVPVRSVVLALAIRAGHPGPLLEGDLPPTGSAEVDWLLADTEAARRLLGWSPRPCLNEALDLLWHSVHPEAPADRWAPLGSLPTAAAAGSAG